MVGPPFIDSTPVNGLLVQRGRFTFFKTQLKSGTLNVSPPDSAFEETDIVTILDPNGNDVTEDWRTNAIDPLDEDDVYDETHTTYVGDLATPENIGLFHNGSGALAQKALVPNDALVSIGGDPYTVNWRVLVTTTPSDSYIEDSETFHVGPAGVLIFGADTVTVAEVEAGINTSLTDEQIEALITEAAENYVLGTLEAAEADTDFTSVPRLVKQATILYTRCLIFQRDASSFTRFNSITEGDTTIRYAGTSGSDMMKPCDEADALLMRYLGLTPNFRKAKFNVIRGGDPLGIANAGLRGTAESDTL